MMAQSNALSSLTLFESARPRASRQGPDITHSKGAAKPAATQSPSVWSSKLDRTVAIGSGQARSQTLSIKDRVTGWMVTAAKGGFLLAAGAIGVALSPLLYAATRYGAAKMRDREYLRETTYVKTNSRSLDALRAHMDPAKCQFGDAATSRFTDQHQAMMDRIVDHARRTGKLAEDGARPTPGKLTRIDLNRLVEVGEGVFNLLQETQPEAIKDLKMPGANNNERLASQYTAKALSWFLMAQAAYRDIQNDVGGPPVASGSSSPLRSMDFETQGSRRQSSGRVSNMATKGAFFIADPGNRVYEFLRSVPTAGPRMSTHAAERSDASAKHKIFGFIPTKKPEQWGIEDYQSTFPGEGGSLLFDKISEGPRHEFDKIAEGPKREPVLFAKFEEVGCPPYFASSVSETKSTRVMRFFAAMSRDIAHSLSFTKTRNSSSAQDPNQVNRHEHVYKGHLKDGVAVPFKSLVKDASRHGIVGPDVAVFGKGMKRWGLSFVVEKVEDIQRVACDLASAQDPVATQIEQRCKVLLATIREEKERLQTDEGIGRRGAESHLRVGPKPPHASAIVEATPQAAA